MKRLLLAILVMLPVGALIAFALSSNVWRWDGPGFPYSSLKDIPRGLVEGTAFVMCPPDTAVPAIYLKLSEGAHDGWSIYIGANGHGWLMYYERAVEGTSPSKVWKIQIDPSGTFRVVSRAIPFPPDSPMSFFCSYLTG